MNAWELKANQKGRIKWVEDLSPTIQQRLIDLGSLGSSSVSRSTELGTMKRVEKILLDLPGIYTFNAVTEDEVVAVQKFHEHVSSKDVSSVLCVLDATNLKASLRLGLEVQMLAAKVNTPVIFALNMMDIIKDNHLDMDVEGLAESLDAPVIPISAKTGEGLDALRAILRVSHNLQPVKFKTLDYELMAQELQQKFGPNVEILFKQQSQLDYFFLSNRLGGFTFALIMLILFQAIFSWAVPFMDMVEWVIESIAAQVSELIPNVVARDFVVDAIFGGIGSFLVFVPQIFFLTFIIGILEDSGYLARAAVICHKPLKLFGLSGKSFIPLLSGHACAIPAIYASRTVASPKRRLLTILSDN